MRVLVDSSAWIDFANGFPSEVGLAFRALFSTSTEICTCGPVVTEVAQGLRRRSTLAAVVDLFEQLTFLEPSGIATYLRAAELYRGLRQQGITVRSTIDCLIAVLAEEEGCILLARDADIERIVASGLVRTGLMAVGEVHEERAMYGGCDIALWTAGAGSSYKAFASPWGRPEVVTSSQGSSI